MLALWKAVDGVVENLNTVLPIFLERNKYKYVQSMFEKFTN